MTKSAAASLGKMSGLLANKGAVVHPATDAVQRGTENYPSKDEKTISSTVDVVNLSAKVTATFRKRIKQATVEAGVTQNELVQLALAAGEKQAA